MAVIVVGTAAIAEDGDEAARDQRDHDDTDDQPEPPLLDDGLGAARAAGPRWLPARPSLRKPARAALSAPLIVEGRRRLGVVHAGGVRGSRGGAGRGRRGCVVARRRRGRLPGRIRYRGRSGRDGLGRGPGGVRGR